MQGHMGKHQGRSGGRRTGRKTVVKVGSGELLGKDAPYCAGSGTQILVYGWRLELDSPLPSDTGSMDVSAMHVSLQRGPGSQSPNHRLQKIKNDYSTLTSSMIYKL